MRNEIWTSRGKTNLFRSEMAIARILLISNFSGFLTSRGKGLQPFSFHSVLLYEYCMAIPLFTWYASIIMIYSTRLVVILLCRWTITSYNDIIDMCTMSIFAHERRRMFYRWLVLKACQSRCFNMQQNRLWRGSRNTWTRSQTRRYPYTHWILKWLRHIII